MKIVRCWMGIALLVGASGIATLAAGADEGNVTVGDLAIRLADMVTGRSYDAEGAISILRHIGVVLPDDPNRSLREGDLIEAADQLGIRLTSADPAREVTPEELTGLGRLFDLESNAAPNPCPPQFDGQSCNAVKCRGGESHGAKCADDADCPGGFCRVPPGLRHAVASESG